jgi:hypothetical protein
MLYVDSHLHIVWTEAVRRWQGWRLGFHIEGCQKGRNPNKIRHLRDSRGCLFYLHAPEGKRAETPCHSNGQKAGLSGISGESADATKGSGSR